MGYYMRYIAPAPLVDTTVLPCYADPFTPPSRGACTR